MVAHLEKSSSPSVGFAILAQLKMINPIDCCQLKKDHIKPQIAVFFKIDIPVQLGPRGLARGPVMAKHHTTPEKGGKVYYQMQPPTFRQL